MLVEFGEHTTRVGLEHADNPTTARGNESCIIGTEPNATDRSSAEYLPGPKLGFGVCLALLTGALAVPASAQMTPAFAQGEYCTQGYFAILMVENMKLNVRQTWNKENAIQALVNLGIEPLETWDGDATLTEGDMVFLLRFIDIPIYTENPEREVTVLEARSICKKFERRFVVNLEAFLMNDNTTFTAVDEWTMEHPSP